MKNIFLSIQGKSILKNHLDYSWRLETCQTMFHKKSLGIKCIRVNGKVSTRIAKITQSQHMDTNYNVIYVSDNFLLL